MKRGCDEKGKKGKRKPREGDGLVVPGTGWDGMCILWGDGVEAKAGRRGFSFFSL